MKIILHSDTSKIVEDEILKMTNGECEIVRNDSIPLEIEPIEKTIKRIDRFDYIESPTFHEPIHATIKKDKSRPYLKKKKGRS